MSFNKKIYRKVLAAVTALTMAFAVTACGEGTSWIAKCQDETINSGIYIYYQTQAMSEATSKLVKDNADLDTKDEKLLKTLTVDGVNVTQWVNEKASKQVKIYAAVNKKFDELGLELSAEDKDNAKSMCDMLWQYYSDMYIKNGIGEESFRQIVEYDYKKTQVFLHYYGEGGEKECDDAELANYLEGNYSRVKYIKFDLTDSEGNALDNDAKAEVKKLAEEYKKKADSGKSFDELIDEYNDYLAKKAEEAAAEEAENAEETEEAAVTTAVSGEEAETTGEVTEAEEDAAVTETSDGEEAAEDEAAVTTAAETEESEEGETTTAAESDEEGASETEAASEDEEPAETTAAVTDENGEAVTEETSEETDESVEETEEDEDPYKNEYVYKKGSDDDGFYPSETVNKAVFNDCKVDGPVVIVEDAENNGLYLIQRLDITGREDYFEGDQRNSMLTEMFNDDFENMAVEWADSYGISFNDASVRRYDPFKIKFE